MIFHNKCWLLIKSLKANKVTINYWFCELEIYGVFEANSTRKGSFRADDERNPGQGGIPGDRQISSQIMGIIKGKRVKLIILNALSPIDGRVLNLFARIR